MIDDRYDIRESGPAGHLSRRGGPRPGANRPRRHLVHLMLVVAAIGAVVGVRYLIGSPQLDPRSAGAETIDGDLDDALLLVRSPLANGGRPEARTSLGQAIRARSKAGKRKEVRGPAKLFELSCVLKRNGRYSAMINGEILTVGQKIDGATVTEIGPRGAKIQVSGRVLALVMPGR